MALLEGRSLSMAFGGLLALRGVDIAIEEHQVVGLLGPNGSGKTTLFNIMSGLLHPTAGEVWFGGRRVTNLAPWRLSGLGVGRTFQIARPFSLSSLGDKVQNLARLTTPLPYFLALDRRREAE